MPFFRQFNLTNPFARPKAKPVFAEPQFAEPAFAEPAEAEPTEFGEQTFAEPLFAEPEFAEPQPGTFGTPEPGEKREFFGEDELDRFIRGDLTLVVSSSNVAYLRYFPVEWKMEIGYKAKGDNPASGYMYSQIEPELAKEFGEAYSKGMEVWDRIRVRGKGNSRLTRKPFVKIY